MRGLGVDLCQVGRIERALQGGDAFLQRFFTAGERDYLASRGQMRAQSAAAMFAAKEAFLKAVGAGIGGGVALDEIEVIHAPGGAPAYRLTGAAEERMRALGARQAFLSLTHEAGMAAAVCVIE